MDTNEQEKPISVISRKPPTDKESWDKFILEQHQKTPDRIEDAAKFVATMISISLSLFLAISGGAEGFLKHANLPAIKAAVIMMVFALIVSFSVLYPYPYKYVKNSCVDMIRVHKKIVMVKYLLLSLGFFLFVVSLSILGWVFL
jgi:hypothetical protein